MGDGAKAIFISGGASGIGLATARLFAERGWRVGLADINAAGLEAAKAALPTDRVWTHVMDVRERDQWEEALTGFVEASGGRLDVLFNNAGIPVGGPFVETDAVTLDRCIAINLSGVVNGAHIGFRLLKATPGSCMLITSSAAGIYGTAGGAIYSATKFAVRGLAEALDGEWAPEGIKVRTIMPSFIETPLLDQPLANSNRTVRESVTEGGLEITPVAEVAEAAWQAVHGEKLHTIVGKTAQRLRFATRWMPKKVRQMSQRRSRQLG
ncbi:SDR family oxidoreductase [Sphingosinithalassobacter sp. LHW66-3]|uniref:SDR family oxidoreductase n=1 Tax=Sphingosinithalassobacter sp. LHW66-3 TaxID=3424718 RepID=UPI003D6B1065